MSESITTKEFELGVAILLENKPNLPEGVTQYGRIELIAEGLVAIMAKLDRLIEILEKEKKR